MDQILPVVRLLFRIEVATLSRVSLVRKSLQTELDLQLEGCHLSPPLTVAEVSMV